MAIHNVSFTVILLCVPALAACLFYVWFNVRVCACAYAFVRTRVVTRVLTRLPNLTSLLLYLLKKFFSYDLCSTPSSFVQVKGTYKFSIFFLAVFLNFSIAILLTCMCCGFVFFIYPSIVILFI